MPNKYFKYSVILLIIYELLIELVSPANGSLLKLLISLLFFSSFISLTIYFFQNYKFHRLVFKPVFIVLLALLILGIINIIRSFQIDIQSIITLFGNKNTGLAMLLPLALILGSKFENILWYNNLSILMLKIGYLLLPLSFLISDIQHFAFFQFSFLLLPITLYVYQKRTDKTIIIVSTVLILTIAIFFGGRLSALQILFLWTGIFFYYMYRKVQLKILRNSIIIVLIALPFVILFTGIPIFEKLASTTDTIGVVETTDTRTFLYQEVMEDLTKANSFFWGKGAMGAYYSTYFEFNQAEGSGISLRPNVEVGVLAMLLKGGIINLFLNLLIILVSIFVAFKSKNKLTEKLVLLVICHFLSLFIGDIPQYSSLSFTMWIAMGGCLSLAVRNRTNKDIILEFKKYGSKKNNIPKTK